MHLVDKISNNGNYANCNAVYAIIVHYMIRYRQPDTHVYSITCKARFSNTSFRHPADGIDSRVCIEKNILIPSLVLGPNYLLLLLWLISVKT